MAHGQTPHADNQAWTYLGLLGGGSMLFAFSLDEDVQRARGTAYSPFLDRYIEPFGTYATLAGSMGFYGYSLLFKDEKAAKTSIALGKALVYSYAATNLLKLGFGRTRPFNQNQQNGSFWWQYDQSFGNQFAFPSGHTTYICAASTVLIYAYPEQDWIKYSTIGLSVAVGFERVYNGRHHLSDVVAGAILGYTIGRLSLVEWKTDVFFLPNGLAMQLTLD